MLWLPTESEDVVTEAEPPLSATVPRLVTPSKNVMFPVGDPWPGEATAIVAVNVTAAPDRAGLLDAARLNVVDAAFTVCDSGLAFAVEYSTSPLYCAVMLSGDAEPVRAIVMLPLPAFK